MNLVHKKVCYLENFTQLMWFGYCFFFFNKKIIKILIEINFFLLISINVNVCLCLGPDADLDKSFSNFFIVFIWQNLCWICTHIFAKNKIKLSNQNFVCIGKLHALFAWPDNLHWTLFFTFLSFRISLSTYLWTLIHIKDIYQLKNEHFFLYFNSISDST